MNVKHYLGAAAIVLVTMAIVYRIPMVRAFVTGDVLAPKVPS